MNVDPDLPVASAIASFVEQTRHRELPQPVLEAAKMCLADWFGVALGACDEPAARSVRAVSSNAHGGALLVSGGMSSALAAALVNGTTSHCLDFDDTHVGSLAHLSAPTWSATLAAAERRNVTGSDLLAAFVTGFETGAALGGAGSGEAITNRGLHSTAVFGRLSAGIAASSILGLNRLQILNSLGVAATQAFGLIASLGTMSKPFHAGKAAMDGVLSAQLAAAGFSSAQDLLDRQNAFAEVLVQDGSVIFRADGLGTVWEVTKNSFKPYASCLLTHPAIDAAREIAKKIDVENVERVVLKVHPLGLKVAGKTEVNSDLEGKFSLAYCTALGMLGYSVDPSDFAESRRSNELVRSMMARVDVYASKDTPKTAASMSVRNKDGSEINLHVPVALGNPENPITWEALESKFMSLAEQRLKGKTKTLFSIIRDFENLKDLQSIAGLLEPF